MGAPEDTESLDPKLVTVYNQVGEYLASFTSGKIPKAFKIIPSLKNWEEILLLTNPDKWTAQSYFVATRLFASNLNEKMAQRFFNTILLPKIREDIEVKKKLNFHLYASIKKAIYKPAAFFRGILLPLAAEDCTAREALIMSSILSKVSIPALHASVALMKLANMPYSGPTTLFMKTLLDKKYSLPYRVVDTMTKHFVKFQNDPRRLPVIWHQNVLMFVQRYKNDLSPEQKDGLRAVLRKHTHPTITAEVRRELNQEVAPTMMEV
jgi:essential nuclear protein 1